MKFRRMHCKAFRANTRQAGFTLAEVLAALVFMAIVIPAAVHGLRLAGTAGEVAQRKTVAVRIAERLLNESIVTSSQAGQSGVVQEGPIQYRWQARNDAWSQDALRQITMTVTFDVQGQEHEVRLSTLFDNAQTTAQTTTP
jgi:prepilin-type N-terminal cleavage/methylation domain-containing protein